MKKKKADLPFRIHLKTDACAFHRQRMLINIVPLYIQLYLCSDDRRPNLLGACKRSLPPMFFAQTDDDKSSQRQLNEANRQFPCLLGIE